MQRWLAALAFIVVQAAAQTSPAPAPLGNLVDVGGYRVHLYCTGSGSPVVMVVGGGFSVDWALVQPEAAKFTAVCTYDVSGTVWSDPGPVLTCRERVNEIHKLVQAARLNPPLVLAGLSIGGCVARLYAAEYPAEVAGVVIVDHAFSPEPDPDAGNRPPLTSAGVDTPPVLLYQAPVMATVEQSAQFSHLPPRMQELHRWAMTLHPKLPEWDDAEDCLTQLKTAAAGAYPLGDKPLAVVSTGNQSRGYDRLQAELVALSHRSTRMLADRSFHSIEIDQPDVVVAAMRWVVDAVRLSTHQK